MVKKSFWLEPEQTKWIEKQAKGKTESSVMRQILDKLMK